MHVALSSNTSLDAFLQKYVSIFIQSLSASYRPVSGGCIPFIHIHLLMHFYRQICGCIPCRHVITKHMRVKTIFPLIKFL